MLTLDFKTITDEILALTALRKATAANPEEGMLVTRDQLPGLRGWCSPKSSCASVRP